MQWDGTSWRTFGIPGFSAGVAENITLELSGASPYLAFRDGSADSKLMVMRFIEDWCSGYVGGGLTKTGTRR
jgi:hypothetical protein